MIDDAVLNTCDVYEIYCNAVALKNEALPKWIKSIHGAIYYVESAIETTIAKPAFYKSVSIDTKCNTVRIPAIGTKAAAVFKILNKINPYIKSNDLTITFSKKSGFFSFDDELGKQLHKLNRLLDIEVFNRVASKVKNLELHDELVLVNPNVTILTDLVTEEFSEEVIPSALSWSVNNSTMSSIANDALFKTDSFYGCDIMEELAKMDYILNDDFNTKIQNIMPALGTQMQKICWRTLSEIDDIYERRVSKKVFRRLDKKEKNEEIVITEQWI